MDIEPEWCGPQEVVAVSEQSVVDEPTLEDLVLHVEAAKRTVKITGAVLRFPKSWDELRPGPDSTLHVGHDFVLCNGKTISLRDPITLNIVGEVEPCEITVGGIALREQGWAAVACGPLTGKRGLITHIGFDHTLTLSCPTADGAKQEVLYRFPTQVPAAEGFRQVRVLAASCDPAQTPVRTRQHFLCGKMVLIHADRKGWARVESVNELALSVMVTWDTHLVSGAQRHVYRTAFIVGVDTTVSMQDLITEKKYVLTRYVWRTEAERDRRMLPNAASLPYVVEQRPRAATPPWTGPVGGIDDPAWDASRT
jgi:hypothetical protein